MAPQVEVADRGRFVPDNEDQRARFGVYAMHRRAGGPVRRATVGVCADSVLDGHGRDRPLVLLGDLNDTPQAGTTPPLCGPSGSQFDTGGFDHPDHG